MENNELFKKYYKKLQLECILKSFSWGMTVACAAMFITAFICWFTTHLGLWISLGVFGAALAASVPCFYFFKFKPTEKDLAKRLDALGLEERMISMLEFGDDGTYLASKICEDANASLAAKTAAGVGLKICVSVLSICIMAGALLMGGGMTTVAALAGSGTIPSGGDIGEIINPPSETYIEIYYVVIGYDLDGNEVDYGGMIEGDDFQLVVMGGDGTPVYAIEEDGWAFVCWDMDEEQNDPYRCDTLVDGDGGEMGEDNQIIVTHTAIFIEIDPDGESDGGGGGGDGENGGEADAPPEEPGENEQNNNSSSTSPSTEGDPSTGVGGKNEEQNQIIDGTQYYRERYEEFYEKAQEYINRGEEVPQYIKDLIDYYYDIIK